MLTSASHVIASGPCDDVAKHKSPISPFLVGG